MKIAKADKPNQGSAAATGPITGENFLERARLFASLGADKFVIRALDGEKGSIRTKLLATEPQWVAWRAWFFSKGMVRWVRVMDNHGMATVPSEYPELFDKDAPLSDPFARLPRRAPAAMETMRGRINELFSGLSGELGMPSNRRRQQSDAQAKQEALALLDQKREEWSSPFELSDAARKFAAFPRAEGIDF